MSDKCGMGKKVKRPMLSEVPMMCQFMIRIKHYSVCTKSLSNATVGLVSYLQKNVHTEYVYSYFVYTGKKFIS